ncbi:MAG: sigma-70 family RNA polymerase sigma factor [Alphaproteobacteria bacterium]|nr:sigma-70 family RNA polymerase sigma factor [Alphaproteobacteria bacterium]
MEGFSPELDQDVYAHLRALAERIYAERGGSHPTLQPTALLHEAWMKLERSSSRYVSRAHFIAVAARAMRQILVNRARARSAQKRGGEAQHRTTLSGIGTDPNAVVDVLTLDEALQALEAVNPRAAEVALLRTFGGLTVPEVAEATGLSEATVGRAWRFARVFLADRLS